MGTNKHWDLIFKIVMRKETWTATHPKGTKWFKDIADRHIQEVITSAASVLPRS